MSDLLDRLNRMESGVGPSTVIAQKNHTGVAAQTLQDDAERQRKQLLGQMAGLTAAQANASVTHKSEAQRYYEGKDQTAASLESVRSNPDFQSVVGQANSDIWRSGNLFTGNANARNVARSIQLLNRGTEVQNKSSAYQTAQSMTKEERDTLMYYGATDQWDKASEYLDSIEHKTNQRTSQELMETAREFSEEHPLLGAVGSVGAGILSGVGYVGNALNAAKNAITGEYTPTDPNSNLFQGAQLSQATTEGVSEAAERMPVLGNVQIGDTNLGSFLAQTGMSMGQFLAAASMGPAGLAVLGSGAAGNTTYDALHRGGTEGQAAALGTAAGLIEAATEKLGLDNLFAIGKTGRSGVASVLRNIAKQAGVEAAEESISEVANTLADIAIMGDQSQVSQTIEQLMSKGMSREEAQSQAFQQVLSNIVWAAAGGGLSGGLIGAGASALNTARSRGQIVLPTANTNLPTAAQVMGPTVEQTETTAEQAATANAGQKNTASTGEAVNENGLTSLTELERTNLSSGKQNKVVSTLKDAVSFVRNALTNRQSSERAYLGKVPNTTAQKVLNDTGVDITGYNAILSSDNVRHIISRHGDSAREALMGQSAVTADDIALIPQVLSAPDNVTLSTEPDNRGRRALVFEKQIGDNYVTVQAVSDGTHSIQTNTLYKQKIKGPTDTGYNVNEIVDPVHNAQSEPPSGPFDGSIPQTGQSVNAVNDNVDSGRVVPTDGVMGRPVSDESTVGAAESGFDPWSHFQNQRSEFFPEGANAARPVDVPTTDPEGRRIRKTASTVMGAKAIPDEVVSDIQKMVLRGELSYNRVTDEASTNRAIKSIQDKGFERAMEEFTSNVQKGYVSKDLATLGQQLLVNAANAGDGKAVAELLTLYAQMETSAGQAVQAASILRKLSPNDQLYGVTRSVSELERAIQKRYKDHEITIDPSLLEEFANQTDQAGRDAVMGRIYQNVADQIPSSWKDKWDAWRYLAMLFNPRTHIRNIAGNIFFQPLRMVKNSVAATVETAVHAINPNFQKTKSFASNPALYRAAWNDWNNVKDVLSGNKYDDIKSEINSRRTIFKGRAAKPIEMARKGNSWALEFEDSIFKRITYADSLAGFLQARGVTAQQISNGTVDSALMSQARDYAGQEALRATYQDRNQLSDLLSTRFREDTTARRIGNMAIDAVLPFRRTPANILVRGFEYSPAGLAKALFADLGKVKQGKMSGAQAIDNIASGLTGSALFALGAYLLSEGIVTSGGGDDQEEDDWNSLTGQQNYALNLPGGGNVTLDWLAPESLPFFMGVELMDSISQNGLSLEGVMDALASVSDPMLELSMLQSLNDLIDSVSYADSVGKLPAMAGSALISYLTQAIPTLGGQIERSGETDRMSSFTDRESPVPSDIQYALSRAFARIPGLDYQQIPYIDAWGRTESNGNPLVNAMNNFLNPAYTSQSNVTAADREIQRLMEAGQTGVVPDRVKQSQKVDDQYLTADEYVTYATVKGQTSYEIVSDMIESDLYQEMTDEQKADAIKRAYQYAGHIAALEINPDHEAESYVEGALNSERDLGINSSEYLLLREEVGLSGIERIEKLMDSGVSYDNAVKTAVGIGGLEPEYGNDQVTDLQRWREVVNSDMSIDQQLSALETMTSESQYKKFTLANDYGINPDYYIDFYYDVLPKYDEPNKNGNLGTYTQDEVEAALDSLGSGVLFPGSKGLTNDQKAAMWQIITGSSSTKNNPYNKRVGQAVLDAMND